MMVKPVPAQERRTKRRAIALTPQEDKALIWAARQAKIRAHNGARGVTLILRQKSIQQCVDEYRTHLAQKAAA